MNLFLKLADAIEVVFGSRRDASRITVSDNTGTATVKQNLQADGSVDISSVECGKENAVGGISGDRLKAVEERYLILSTTNRSDFY
jgi:hypothetical protein